MKENKNKRLWIRVSETEHKLLSEHSKNYKSISDYIRARIFKRGPAVLNPVELIRVLDELSREMKMIGNNINQVAKIANQRKEFSNEKLMEEYNSLLNDYITVQKKLETSYRKIISL